MPGLHNVNLLREPLIQFLLLGAMIFAVDYYITSNADNPRRIVVDDNRVSELITIFREGQGRDPSPQEIDNLIVVWTQNEILYREALQMGLDKGDEMIRSRVILKIRNVLFNSAIVETPADDELQRWFEQYREVYDSPAYYDIEQFRLADTSDTAAAQQLAEQLGTAAPSEPLSDTLRSYRRRPASNLVSLFGEQDSEQLLNNPINQWTVVTSDRGLHLARLTRHYEAKPAQFAKVKNQVIRDWKKYTNNLQLARQTKEIADRYEIELMLTDNKYLPTNGDDKPSQSSTSGIQRQPQHQAPTTALVSRSTSP